MKKLVSFILGSAFISMVCAEPSSDPGETIRQRITAKASRVQEVVQTWAATGRDPSTIARVVGINVGATDPSLMSYLSKGAFGDEAMAAYKKFLMGEPLIEK